MNALAPIVLFVYNRPWHTKQTVTALLKNELADASDLIVYSDAPKNEAAVPMVEGVRSFIKGISGFKSVSIIKREKNWGLAESIIDGVTTVVNKYGKVIVLEDDIVTSPFFLRFMNDALTFYENEQKVWHINGYMFPIDTVGLNDTFFTQGMFCWGWATWERAWKHYTRNPENTPSQFNKKMVREFDYENTNKFFDQLRANKSGKLHTWAIFWYATIFLHKALCLSSKNSLTQNIGLDGSGIHCGESDVYEVPLQQNVIYTFELNIQESATARNRLIHFFKHVQPSLVFRIRRKVLKHLKNIAFLEH